MNELRAFVLLLFSGGAIAQQSGLAVIDEGDGNVTIHSGRGTNFPKVETISAAEVFSYEAAEEEDWWKVSFWKFEGAYGTGITKEYHGFVLANRIMPFASMSDKQRKIELGKIFNRELRHAKDLNKRSDENSLEYRDLVSNARVYHTYHFEQVLEVFTDLVCRAQDKELFRLFNKVMGIEEDYVDYTSLKALGIIYQCQPDWALENIPKTEEFFAEFEEGCKEIEDEALREKLNNFKTDNGW